MGLQRSAGLEEDSLRSARRHPDESQGRGDGDERSEFEHDRDRILYSQAFRRLSGITQVISPGRHSTHNRLTHTLEVAQIARSIAARIINQSPDLELLKKAGGLNPVVVEAASLAHDLGHPPFGHVAEDVLREKLEDRNVERFEGNAQTFRILNKLAIREDRYDGLNLTRATLSAVSKYPWKEERSGLADKKWGAYYTELQDLRFSREHLDPYLRNVPQSPNYSYRTLEARIMDWADDVAYAIHDVEDFFRVGMIPLDRLRNNKSERTRFIQYHIAKKQEEGGSTPKSIIEERCEILLHMSSPFFEPYTGDRLSRATLHRHSSSLIHKYIVNVGFTHIEQDPGWDLHLDNVVRVDVDILKRLLWYYVMDNRALLTLRFGYSALIGELFERLSEAAHGKKRNPKMFPEFYEASLITDEDESNAYRVVADFIASMTEFQVEELYHRMTGMAFGSSLDRITD